MGNDTGFLEFKKESPPLRPVEERVLDYQEYDTFFSDKDLQQQAARCMDCGVPFCHMGCPLGNMIPDWNDLVYQGNWKEALESLHSTNNFPEFTGRICPAPCEESCVLTEHYTLDSDEKLRKVNAVTIEEIEKHISERGWDEGWIKAQPPSELTDKRVAIIGSGPAGLAAAQQLRRSGHSVTVFEKDDKIGGLLVYGIPDFKLEKKVVSRRVEQLRQEGVDFHTCVNVGIDLSVKELQKSFDAVLLAIGAQNARKLTTDGHDLNGVHYAMDFLPQCNRGVSGDFIPEDEKIYSGNKLAIILGGGFTAADCLGNVNRQGAKPNVRQFELVNMEPRPTPVHEEANTDCRANILTEALIDDGEGNVKALQGITVEWERKNGEIIMRRLEGSEFTVSADIVLLAMGFLGPIVDGLLEELEVELSVFGTKKSRNPAQVKKMLKNAQPVYSIHSDENFMTSREGVFVAGDANRGASLVVWAIWEGREAARCIDSYLMGSSVLPSTPQAEVLV